MNRSDDASMSVLQSSAFNKSTKESNISAKIGIVNGTSSIHQDSRERSGDN